MSTKPQIIGFVRRLSSVYPVLHGSLNTVLRYARAPTCSELDITPQCSGQKSRPLVQSPKGATLTFFCGKLQQFAIIFPPTTQSRHMIAHVKSVQKSLLANGSMFASIIAARGNCINDIRAKIKSELKHGNVLWPVHIHLFFLNFLYKYAVSAKALTCATCIYKECVTFWYDHKYPWIIMHAIMIFNTIKRNFMSIKKTTSKAYSIKHQLIFLHCTYLKPYLSRNINTDDIGLVYVFSLCIQEKKSAFYFHLHGKADRVPLSH